MYDVAFSQSRPRLVYPWLFNKQLDVLFFFVPVLFGLAVFQLTVSSLPRESAFWAVVVLMASGIGPLHSASTWFTYLDKKNRQYFKSNPFRAAVYYVATPLIVALTMAIMLWQPYGQSIVTVLFVVWTTQHLMQQNIGILLLYHHKVTGEAIVNRNLEKHSILSATIFFCLLSGLQLNLLGLKDAPWLPACAAAACAWMLVSCALYVMDIHKQYRDGASLNVPALAYWLVAVLFMLPCGCFVGHDFNQAFTVPLMVHWFQYIGLNYVLVSRKYSADDRRDDLPFKRPILLFALSSGIFFFVFVLIMWVAGGKSGIPVQDWHVKLLTGFAFGVSFAHYFVDSFIWRFREPHARENVLPFLKRPATPSMLHSAGA